MKERKPMKNKNKVKVYMLKEPVNTDATLTMSADGFRFVEEALMHFANTACLPDVNRHENARKLAIVCRNKWIGALTTSDYDDDSKPFKRGK